MKINIPKAFEYKPTLGDELENLSFKACEDWISDAMDYVSDLLKELARKGHYTVSIAHKDIQQACKAPESSIRFVITHLENWLIAQGVQIIEAQGRGDMLSLAWGVGKMPSGFKSMIISEVRG